MQIAGP